MPAAQDNTVLILAPVGQDASAMAALLQAHGISTCTSSEPADCSSQMADGAGALLLTDESLELPHAPALFDALKAQPAWSELPVLILTRSDEQRVSTLLDLAASAAGTVTLLERPMSATTLVRSVQVALRSRRRQYEVRDLLVERKEAAERLRQVHQRLEYHIQNTPLAVIEFDSELRVSAWSAGAQRIFGWAPAEVLGQLLWEVPWIFEEDRAKIQQVSDGLSTGKTLRSISPNRNLRKDGKVIWCEWYNSSLTDSAGKMQSIQSLVLDVTERKEFQSELERLVTERTAKLQELVSELEHFSYTITHDMRAPLRAMQGFAEMFAEAHAEGQTQDAERFLHRIRTAANRMDALIVDALSYSEAIRKHLPLATVDPGLLLRGMLDTYPELAAPNVRIEVQPAIPRVFANEAGLTQVFSNLLNNAIKFAKPGQAAEIRISAEITPHQPEPGPDPLAAPRPAHSGGFAPMPSQPTPGNGLSQHRVRIWIEDNGIGISERMLPRIFNLFARGHAAQAGTGLGLALVRKVMDRMGGRLGVESQEGQGSRFWIELAAAN